jgi:hypothetical protein
MKIYYLIVVDCRSTIGQVREPMLSFCLLLGMSISVIYSKVVIKPQNGFRNPLNLLQGTPELELHWLSYFKSLL